MGATEGKSAFDLLNVQERYEVGDSDCYLHVMPITETFWQVWLNTSQGDMSGVCVGQGRVREEAVAHAIQTLEAAALTLRKSGKWSPNFPVL